MTKLKLNKSQTKISTFSLINKNSDKFNENYFFEISTFEYLRFHLFLCRSNKMNSKMEFFLKAKELIKRYSSIENLIYYIQQSETLKNYLIKNQDKIFFNQLIKHSMIDEIGIYDKSIFSRNKI